MIQSDEVSTTMLNDFIQSTMAPISKQLIETDASLINTQVWLIPNLTNSIVKLSKFFNIYS